MTSQIRPKDLLVESMQHEPEYYSFGGLLAEQSARSISRGDRNLPHEAQRTAEALQKGVRQLLQSSAIADMDAVNTVGWIFRKKDHEAFITRMRGMYESEPGSNVLTWISSASYRDIAVLALWNRDRRNRLQWQLDEDHTDLIDDALADVETHIKNGIYPAQALGTYEGAFKKYGKFKAIDSFESGLMGADAYCSDELIGMSNLYLNTDLTGISNHFRDVVIHEGTHAVGNNKGENSRGFDKGIATPFSALRPLEEYWASMTEAPYDWGLTLDAKVKSNLDMAKNLSRNYVIEGTLFRLLSSLHPSGIPQELYGHAYISHQSEREAGGHRHELERRLCSVIGKDAFFTLASKYMAAEAYTERSRLVTNEINRLLGGKNNLVEHGWSEASNITRAVADETDRAAESFVK